MHSSLTQEFIKRIPKTDLHLHLDGSLRLPTLIELARQENITLPSYEEAGLKELVFKPSYASLKEYLQGFAYTCGVMRSAENIERVAFELAEDNLAEGVRYIEVRYAPQLHLRDDLNMESVVRAVSDGLTRAQKAHNNSEAVRKGEDIPFHFGIIVCAMRAFNQHMGAYFKSLLAALPTAPKKELFSIASHELVRQAVAMREKQGLPIVGFDLAGEEAGYPAAYHMQAYQYAHRSFLKKTVHAGEAYGPESIFQAITDCHANRIGHGTFLFAHNMIKDKSVGDPKRYVELLADYIATQRITIEVCLTSNLQTTPEITSIATHPARQMIEDDVAVAICTDNRLVSNTTVSRELTLAAEGFDLTPRQFRNVIIAGFKGSFFNGTYREKRGYVRQARDMYDRIERDLARKRTKK